MKQIIYTLFSVALLTATGINVSAQTWRGRHNGLPSGFSPSKVFGDGTNIIVTNTSGTTDYQVYYTPDSTTPYASSPSSLGLFAPMESQVAKARGILFVSSTTGIYKSHDNGATWVAAGTGGLAYGMYSHNDTLYAGSTSSCKMSVDTGNTWTDMGYTGGLAITFLKSGGTLFVGSTSALKYTNDGGHTWTTVSSPGSLGGVSIVGIAELGGNIYAACSNGVYQSTDHGSTWTTVMVRDMFSLIAVDTSLFGGTATNGLYQSDQSGTNWTAINNGLPYTGTATYDAIDFITYNDDYVICKVSGSDSAIYVIGLGELGLTGSGGGSTTNVKTTAKPVFGCTLIPNPASNEIHITLQNSGTGDINVTLTDIIGRTVKQAVYTGKTDIKIPLNDVNAGTYFVSVTTGNEHTAKKLVVIK